MLDRRSMSGFVGLDAARRGFWLALAVVAAGACLGSETARASEVGTSRKIGLGVALGQPSGATVKWFFARNHALQGTLGVGFLGGYHLRLNAEYLFHIRLTSTADFDLPIYFGAGVSFFTWFHYVYPYYWFGDGQYITYFGIGLRVPVGVALHFHKVPMDVFAQVAPGVGLFPGIGFTFDGTAGFRYYF